MWLLIAPVGPFFLWLQNWKRSFSVQAFLEMIVSFIKKNSLVSFFFFFFFEYNKPVRQT